MNSFQSCGQTIRYHVQDVGSLPMLRLPKSLLRLRIRAKRARKNRWRIGRRNAGFSARGDARIRVQHLVDQSVAAIFFNSQDFLRQWLNDVFHVYRYCNFIYSLFHFFLVNLFQSITKIKKKSWYIAAGLCRDIFFQTHTF